MRASRYNLVTICSATQRLAPPARVEAMPPEHEPRIYMQAFDERGVPWARMPPILARMERAQTETGLELWLVAEFFWASDCPSPLLAKIRVSGWRVEHDYIVTPSSPTQCVGDITSIIAKVPTQILN